MPSLFITGTGTDVGKTIVTGLLARFLIDRGEQVITQKWIQTGSGPFPDDIQTHLSFMNRDKAEIEPILKQVAPYTFPVPASPHLAARLASSGIKAEVITEAYKQLVHDYEWVLIEGAGGVLVPFTDEQLMIDIAEDLSLPILVVAENRLGAINHTLLTIEALKNRNMNIIGIIFSRTDKDENEAVLEDNLKVIEQIGQVPVLGEIPWSKDREVLISSFADIGENLLSRFKGEDKDD